MKKNIIILLGVFFLSFKISAQSKNLTIKVKDEKNKPVAGAIILFDDTRQKRWTNSNGVFKITLEKDPIVISAFHPTIGIKKIKYDGKKNLTIKIKKGNDFEVVNNSKGKSIDSNQFNDIYDYLRGRIPGVNVDSENNIVIRGYNSINGVMTPLYVLNNNTVSAVTFGSIVPNQIKSVTVLKGPETSRYGVRGANGVIVVETL